MGRSAFSVFRRMSTAEYLRLFTLLHADSTARNVLASSDERSCARGSAFSAFSRLRKLAWSKRPLEPIKGGSKVKESIVLLLDHRPRPTLSCLG